MGWWNEYERTRPKAVKGGIKAQSKSGAFGKTWWAKRWMATLEAYGLGARLSRGRTYARKGQVLSIEVANGVVTSKVQGSRATPYKVVVRMKTLTGDEWDLVAKGLLERPIFAARLLAGEMPEEIEEVFAAAGLSLFPERVSDLVTDCSCPDWSNPCKHTAAVYCLLGEEFDRDPFLLFTLRGMDRERLFASLPGTAEPAGDTADEPDQPLTVNGFWTAAPVPLVTGDCRTPPVSAPLIRRLGGFPLWRGEVPLLECVEPIYARASARGLDIVASRE